jgi:hypothetical protein
MRGLLWVWAHTRWYSIADQAPGRRRIAMTLVDPTKKAIDVAAPGPL